MLLCLLFHFNLDPQFTALGNHAQKCTTTDQYRLSIKTDTTPKLLPPFHVCAVVFIVVIVIWPVYKCKHS